MWPLSPAAQAALRAGLQTVVSRATAYTADHGVVPPDLLPMTSGGKVSMDGTAMIRAKVDVTFAEPKLWPVDPASILSPFSSELFIERGIVLLDGGIEWVPMGVFGIVEVTRTGRGSGGIKVSGKDRAAAIERDRFDVNTQAPVGAGAVETMVSYVHSTFPEVVVHDLTSTSATVSKADFQRDKLGAVGKLATAASVKGYFDRLGDYVIRDLPTLDDDPVWTIDAGPRGVLVQSDEKATSAVAYNRFRASGANSTSTAAGGGAAAPPPPFAVVVDDDPSSPFYIGEWDETTQRWVNGRMRPATRFYASPLLTTEAQCLAVAQDLREKVRGLGYTVDFSAAPNPALDPDDVFLARAAYRSPNDSRHLIESLDHSLSAGGGAQSMATRGDALPDEDQQQDTAA